MLQLDSENADRNLTSLVTVLTHTPSASLPLRCQSLVCLGDGSKNLDGTGGDFEVVVTVGGQTVEPSPQTIAFSTAVRAAFFTAEFPVPANAEVVVKVLSPNVADTDVDVTAYLYDVIGTVAKTGADGDTLETLSDQIDLLPTRAPATYYVDGTNGNDANDGLRSVSAKQTINAAAGNNRKVIVAAGTYSGATINFSSYSNVELWLEEGVTITYDGNHTLAAAENMFIDGPGTITYAGSTADKSAIYAGSKSIRVGDRLNITSGAIGILATSPTRLEVGKCRITAKQSAIRVTTSCNQLRIDQPIITMAGWSASEVAAVDLTACIGYVNLPVVYSTGSTVNYNTIALKVAGSSLLYVESLSDWAYLAGDAGTGEVISLSVAAGNVIVQNVQSSLSSTTSHTGKGIAVSGGQCLVLNADFTASLAGGTQYDLHQSGAGVLIVGPGVHYDTTKTSGTIIKTTDTQVWGGSDAATLVQAEAEDAIDAKFTFVSDRVKAIAQTMAGGIGQGDVFLFSIAKTEAEPYIIVGEGSSSEDFEEYDGIRRVTTYTGVTTGTQWQLTATVVQDDPSGANPPIYYSSSNESVATVTDDGFVHYQGDSEDNGDCIIVAESAPTEHSPAFRIEVPIINTSTEGDNAEITTYIPDTFNAADHMLVCYNADVANSVTLKNYYLANRPGVSGANTLGITGLPDSTTATLAQRASLNDQIETWMAANPTKAASLRYVVLMRGLPSRYDGAGGNNVARFLSGQLGDARPKLHGETLLDYEYVYNNGTSAIAPFSAVQFPCSMLITYIDMGSYADSTAYIDKLAAMAEVEGALGADGATITASDGGYGADRWVLDDTRESAYIGDPQMPVRRAALLAAGIADEDITYQPTWNGTRVSSAADVTCWKSWGIHTPLADDWPLDSVTFTGDSGWYLLSTVESYNGQYGSTHGDPTEFFAATAFGGTAYANTPVFFYGHTNEPYIAGLESKLYEQLWAEGYYALDAAWKASNFNPLFCGDPLVKR